MIEVALFPIPNCVAFPGTVYPLHVFEPRYRQMVHDCLDKEMLLGICHTEVMLSPAKRSQSLDEALKTNQATYKPYSVFSAGRVELKETLSDGRLLIDVHLTTRLKTINEIQTLPYFIYQCEDYSDRPVAEDILQQATLLKAKLLKKLIGLTADNPLISNHLASAVWQQMDVVEFSFQLFGLLQMEGDIQQQILQCRSPLERLTIAQQMLNKI